MGSTRETDRDSFFHFLSDQVGEWMEKPYKLVVKAIIFDEKDRVLILRRSKNERKKKETHVFDFPGGSLEEEESLLEGLDREIYEETGLQVDVIAPAYVYDEIQEEKHLVIVKFACHQPVGDFLLSDEHDHYEWVSVRSLDQHLSPDWMKDEILQAYRIYQSF